MKEKFLVLFSMVMILFIVVVPIVFASSPFVIGEEKAGGYQYTVIKEQNSFSWKIGHQDNISTIVQNKDNIEVLDHFRTAVEDMNMDIYGIIIAASYLLIVVITTLIFYKKTKQIPIGSGAIIAILAGIAVYYTIENSISTKYSITGCEVLLFNLNQLRIYIPLTGAIFTVELIKLTLFFGVRQNELSCFE